MDVPKHFISCCLQLVLSTLAATTALAQDNPLPDSRLYNGHEYIRNGVHARGFAFFLTDSLQPGTILYDGIPYREIPLQYDLVQDELIIPDYTGKALISLIPDKVSRFTIHGHHFSFFSPAAPGPKMGFYEILCSGRDSITLLARHEKRLIFPNNLEESARYQSYDLFFLRIGKTWNPVDGESSLLALLRDKKALLKKYIRDNDIRFKKDPGNALMQTTSYYLKLPN